MSQPSLGGDVPKLAVETGIVRVVNDGDYFTQGGDTVTHRCLHIVDSAGRTVFGSNPGKSTPIDTKVAGAGTRDQVAQFRIALGPGVFQWRMWGGVHSRYVRQDGTVAYDVMEWGDHDLTYPDRQSAGVLTVPAGGTTVPPLAPPKPVPAMTLASQTPIVLGDMYALVEQWRKNGLSEAQIGGTFWYLMMKALMLPPNDPKRLAARKFLAEMFGA